MNFSTANRSPALTNMTAVAFGTLAMLRAWVIIHPSRNVGFTGSLALIAFEVIKTTALLLILSRVYMLNSSEEDQTVRSSRVWKFAMAAWVSVLIDTGITLFKL